MSWGGCDDVEGVDCGAGTGCVGAGCVFWNKLAMSTFFLGFPPAGAGESVRWGADTFPIGDAGAGSVLAAEIEPKVLICLMSAMVDGAAGDVDTIALLSSIDPNCTLLTAFAGMEGTCKKKSVWVLDK